MHATFLVARLYVLLRCLSSNINIHFIFILMHSCPSFGSCTVVEPSEYLVICLYDWSIFSNFEFGMRNLFSWMLNLCSCEHLLVPWLLCTKQFLVTFFDRVQKFFPLEFLRNIWQFVLYWTITSFTYECLHFLTNLVGLAAMVTKGYTMAAAFNNGHIIIFGATKSIASFLHGCYEMFARWNGQAGYISLQAELPWCCREDHGALCQSLPSPSAGCRGTSCKKTSIWEYVES